MKRESAKYYIYIGFILLSITFGFVRYLLSNNGDFRFFGKYEKANNINIENIKDIFDEVKYNMSQIKEFYNYNEEINNYIHFEKAKSYNENKTAIFIDTRSLNEINENQVIVDNKALKTIPDAIIIPIEDIETIYNETDYFYEVLDDEEIELLKTDYENEMKVVTFFESLPKDINYIVYCGSSLCDKSQRLVDMMRELLFQKVGLYKDGWEDWTPQGPKIND